MALLYFSSDESEDALRASVFGRVVDLVAGARYVGCALLRVFVCFVPTLDVVLSVFLA
jgi:hypothetical protein